MTICELMKLWSKWANGGALAIAKPQENVLHGWVHGQVKGRAVYCSGIPADADFGDLSPDQLFVGVERAVAKLPKRQREAVVLEFLREPNANHEEKGLMMRPPCTRVTFTRHLNSALNQLAVDLNVDNV